LYTGGRLSDVVVANRLEDGQIFIRDPAAGGSTYRMLIEELQRVWNGNVARL
jgi:hypothetical protein